jgi:hypothetical protein
MNLLIQHQAAYEELRKLDAQLIGIACLQFEVMYPSRLPYYECRINEDGDAEFYKPLNESNCTKYLIKIDQRFNDSNFFEVLREDKVKRQADIKTEEKAKALERIKKSLAHAQSTVEELTRELKNVSK